LFSHVKQNWVATIDDTERRPTKVDTLQWHKIKASHLRVLEIVPTDISGVPGTRDVGTVGAVPLILQRVKRLETTVRMAGKLLPTGRLHTRRKP
jgi:hypothetical protein